MLRSLKKSKNTPLGRMRRSLFEKIFGSVLERTRIIIISSVIARTF